MSKPKVRRREGFIILATIVLLVMAIAYYFYARNEPVSAECIGEGATLLINPPIREFIAQSSEIIVGNPELTRDGKTKIMVTDHMKGHNLSKGDTVTLCAPDARMAGIDYERPALIFLKGVDKEKVWVPVQFSMGIISAEEDGSFEVGQDQRGYSIQEIQKAVDKSGSK